MKSSIILVSFLSVLLLGFHNLLSNENKYLQGLCDVNGASGSIVKIDKDYGGKFCYVLTAAHVIEQVPEPSEEDIPFAVEQVVLLRVYDKRGNIRIEEEYIAEEIVEINEELDYAILKVYINREFSVVECIEPKEVRDIDVGDTVYSIGKPAGEAGWVNRGIMSNLTSDLKDLSIWYGHDSGVWFGNSGGILRDNDMRQIGVNVMLKASEVPPYGQIQFIQRMGYALPMIEIYKDLGSEKTSEYFTF